MSDTTEKKPELASLVRQGDAQVEAIRIAGFLFMVKDISNLHLVTTDDGDLMVNTGFMDNAERNLALLAPHRTGPMRRIVLTQGHADHFGCLDDFREPGTSVIVGPDFEQNVGDM